MVWRRGRLRIVVRFGGAVLAVSGVLLVLDAVVTLVWQEPISAAIARGEQSALERELANVAPGSRRTRADTRSRPADPADWGRRTGPGQAFGRISMPALGQSFVMVEGVGTGALRQGPGHYPDTSLPGERGTVAVAGHRTTYLAPFRAIDQLVRGDRIVLEMPYGSSPTASRRRGSSPLRRPRSRAGSHTTGSF